MPSFDQSLFKLQGVGLREVASGLSLADMADGLCRRVEAIFAGVACSVLTVDRQGRLHPLAGPSLPAAYSAALDGTSIGPTVGSCGAAAYLGIAVETFDIERDPHWLPYRALPLEAGLRACWSSPIKDGEGRVVATFAFYFHEKRFPTADERRVVEVCVDTCSVAINREEINADLVIAHRNLQVALHSMTQGLCLFDRFDRLLLANQRFSEIYGHAAENLGPGVHFRDVLADSVRLGNHARRSIDDVWLARKAFIDKGEVGIFLQELGDGRLIAISHQPLEDGGWVATYEDVTERERYQARMAHLAQHDVLTGLPNRAVLQDRLKLTLEQRGELESCALFFVDLDQFKAVNDTLGHQAGDSILLEASDRLRNAVRDGDLVARLGGDEFSVLTPFVEHPRRAGELAARLVKVLSAPYVVDGKTVSVSASVGIALSPFDGNTGAQLLQSADKALYLAKADGRNTHRFLNFKYDKIALASEPKRFVKNS